MSERINEKEEKEREEKGVKRKKYHLEYENQEKGKQNESL